MTETSQNQNSKVQNQDQGKPKKRDRSASEERLITAGLEIFSKYGFNGATTKMIAKKADVNESLIGRYFDGKEGLLLVIVQRFIEELVHRDLPYEPKNSLTEELEAYVLDRLENGCQHEDFAKLLISHALVDRKFKKRAMDTIPMQLDPRLIQRVQRLSELGKLKPGTDVHTVCLDIDTYMDGVFFVLRVLHESPVEELGKQTIRFIKTYAKAYEKE